MSNLARVLVPFADLNVGDEFRVGQLETARLMEKYKYLGDKPLYFSKHTTTLDTPDSNVHILQPEWYEFVFEPLLSIHNAPIIHTDEHEVQDMEDLCSDLNLDYSGINNWRVTMEPFSLEFFKRWYCTDQWVGYGWLLFNGERVALFSQSGRKSPCGHRFFSKEHAIKVRQWLLSNMNREEEEEFPILDPNANYVEFLRN